ncbi:MAG: hypothetical protein ABI831_06830 [Betaproteobacteria bacterium]
MTGRLKQTLRAHTAEAAKENPIKTASAIVIALGVIIGGFIAGDERYAHAGEVNKQFSAIATGQEIGRLTSEVASLRTDRRILQGQIDATKGPARARLESDLRQIEADVAAKTVLLDKLKTGK